jgi:leader peptidase (prepilin peptidase)/N-methyltransferase
MAMAIILGLVLGSFLNVCIYRIPRGESISYPPSHCPHCNSRLSAPDLIPIASYAALSGRCRHCRGKISAVYPIVEAVNALLYFLIYKHTGFSFAVLPLYILASALVAVSAIDMQCRRIPNVITYPGVIAGIVLSALPGGIGLRSSLLGAAVGGGLLLLVVVASRGGMGLGDSKLMAMVGAFLGWQTAVYSIFLGSVAGSVIGLSLMALKIIKRREPIPFGPFLALGAVLGYIVLESGYRGTLFYL